MLTWKKLLLAVIVPTVVCLAVQADRAGPRNNAERGEVVDTAG